MSTLQIETPRVFVPLLSPARYKGAKGGRGSGKSHFFAERLIEEAVSEHIRCACLREHQNSIKESSKQLLEDKIEKLGVRSLFEITDHEIRGPNGSLFIFRGLQNHTADSLKSLQGFNRGWVDEAHKTSQKSLSILTPTFRAEGTELFFSWNPEGESDPVDAFFRDNKDDPDVICVRANYWDNPWFPEALRGDMERDRRRDPDKYAHVWLGEYQNKSEARVFRNWCIDTLDIPEQARPLFGADWGFSVDPTVGVRCWAWDRTLYVDKEVYQVGCEIDRTPELFSKLNDNRVRDVSRWPMTADSARPETIDYMKRHGFPRIEAAIKGPGSVEDGIEFLKSYDIVVHPDCRHAADELSKYSYKIDKRTEEVLPVINDADNHVIDALRYAIEKLRRHSLVITKEMVAASARPQFNAPMRSVSRWK